MGCHFLLQGILLTQRSNPHIVHLLHWQADSLPLCHLGSPIWNSNSTTEYPKKTTILKDTCTPMFTEALLIARTWEQPRHPSIDEWIKKLWYIYTMEYYCYCCSVAKSCTFLCNPIDCSMPGLPEPHNSSRVCPGSCPLSRWCYPIISSSAITEP